jgi:hypothetical protein
MTQAEKLGKKVVELFNLKEDKSEKYNPKRYKTSWGNKTMEGVGQCVFRLVEENEDNKE